MVEQVLIWVFWVSFASGLYVYFIYPAILALLSGMFGRPTRIETQASDEDWPVVALLIACFNEEKEIENKLRNVVELDYPSDRLVVLIINDGSQDATSDLARSFAATHPEKTIEVLDLPGNRGKSAALFQGIAWLKVNRPDAGIFASTDANAHWEKSALKKIIRPFQDPKVGSVSGLLRYKVSEHVPAGRMEGLYWQYEAMLKRQSSRLGTLPGANGSIFAIRLDAYDPLSETRGDDFELAVQAILKGFRSILVDDAVSREKPSMDFISEYRRKVRITGQMIPSTLILFWRALTRPHALIAFQLFSHKLLRYLVPFFQITLLASSAFLWNAVIFYRIAFLIQVVFYALAILGLLIERAGIRPPKICQIPLYFTMVNTASFVSIIRAVAGQEVSWERNR